MIGEGLPREIVAAPYHGYRMWRAQPATGVPVLTRLTSQNGTEWPVGSPLTAECLPKLYAPRVTDPCPKAPTLVHAPGCGIYAWKTLAYGVKQFTSDWWLWGEVDLWGAVYPHEFGYRAQLAEPTCLYEHGMTAACAKRLADLYGLPLLPFPDLPGTTDPDPDDDWMWASYGFGY